jgi:hypothetical protein
MAAKSVEILGGATIWHFLVSLLCPHDDALAPLWWGPPGFGKTSMIEQAAEAIRKVLKLTPEQYPLETMIGSTCDPTDFRGLPYPTADGTRYEPPEEAVRLARAMRGILFLDEVGNTLPATQAALLRVVHKRTMGLLALPREVRAGAASNPPEEAAGGWEQAAAMGNRWTHLVTTYDDLESDADSWIAYQRHGTTQASEVPVIDPDRYDVGYKVANTLATSWIQRHPRMLTERHEEYQGRWPLAFASRRSWSSLIALHASCRALGREEELDVFARGSIGPARAIQYTAYVREADLPDPEVLLRHPDRYTADRKRPDRDFATALMVAEAATKGCKGGAEVDEATMKRYVAGWKVLGTIMALDKALVTQAVSEYMVPRRPAGGLSHPETRAITHALAETLRAAGAAL